jgi:hypothetical protein
MRMTVTVFSTLHDPHVTRILVHGGVDFTTPSLQFNPAAILETPTNVAS